MGADGLGTAAALREVPAQQQLQLVAPDELTEQEQFAGLAVDALFAFAGDFCAPLGVALWCACCDAYTGYPVSGTAPAAPYWVCRQRGAPLGPRARAVWTNERVSEVDRLDGAAVRELVREGLGQECGSGGLVTGWREISVVASAVRLPPSIVSAASSFIRIAAGAGTIDHPVDRREGAIWVAGPLPHKTLVPPVELRVMNEAGLLTFDASVYWSIWATEDAPGATDLAAAVERVITRGWSPA